MKKRVLSLFLALTLCLTLLPTAAFAEGKTGGEDGTYVYLNSGDTITVSQAGSGFSFTAESVSTEELEANFLVAVPDANVQKVVIPQRGSPYPLKSTEIRFNMPNGALVVTKTDAANGAVLVRADERFRHSCGDADHRRGRCGAL